MRPLVLCAIVATAAFAQVRPQFEVASLRLTTPLSQAAADNAAILASGGKPVPHGVSYSGQRIRINGLTLKSVIATAWGFEPFRVEAPAWTADARIVLDAIMPEGTTRSDVPAMLKALLTERFRIQAHVESRQESVMELVVAPGGARLNPPRDLDRSSCETWNDDHGYTEVESCTGVRVVDGRRVISLAMSGGRYGSSVSRTVREQDPQDGYSSHREFFRLSMGQLADRLSVPCTLPGQCVGLPVVDRTGIKGEWNLAIDRRCVSSICTSYAAALEKLGLKLEKSTAPIEHLVIDQIDKTPADN
ncbi:MAG TPA: TIGR03435 family protein [Bryobacteraceae bacterium]|nr:TIGR03435 family protein [Bryobacteraceae bacterium]